MVSVVMTTYNGEKYLLEQLESLRTQSMPIDEVLISDDGSTDNTVNLVQSYIESNQLNNWVFRVNSENKGWRRNFVETASEAKGDYIFFCDQDDIWMPHKVKVMVDEMNKNHDIMVLAGGYLKFQNDIDEARTNEIRNGGITVVQANSQILYTEYPGCVYCVRREFWTKIILEWNGIFSHDGICWAAAKLLNGAYILNMPVIFWRQHYDSAYTNVSRSIKEKNNRLEWLKNSQKNVECLEEIGVLLGASEESCNRIYRYKQFNSLRIEMLSRKKLVNALKLLKYIDCYSKVRQYFLEVYLTVR